MAIQIVIERNLQDRVNKRLRRVMPGMAITIDVYAQSRYGARAAVLLLNKPKELLRIIDDLLQNSIARRIVLSHIIRAILSECGLESSSDIESLTNKCINSPETFVDEFKKIIKSRLRNGVLKC